MSNIAQRWEDHPQWDEALNLVRVAMTVDRPTFAARLIEFVEGAIARKRPFVVHQSLAQANLDGCDVKRTHDTAWARSVFDAEAAKIRGEAPQNFVTEARCRERERAAYEQGVLARSSYLDMLLDDPAQCVRNPDRTVLTAEQNAKRLYPDPA